MIKLKNLLFEVLENVPQRGPSGGEPIKWKPDANIIKKQLNISEILNGDIKGIPPYYNDVVNDYDNKDFSWEGTKQVMVYAEYAKKKPQSIEDWPPIIVVDNNLQDGSHRIATIYLLMKRMDSENYSFWKNVKLKVEFGTSADVAS